MSKSHYFVQKPPEEQFEGKPVKECAYCSRLFVPKTYNQRYCSRECYKQGVKKTKAEWFQKNKPRLMEKQQRKRRANGVVPAKEYHKLHKARKYRNKIIKSGLVNLELFDMQIREKRFETAFSLVGYPAKGLNHAKVELITSKLHEYGLYQDEIEASDKYPLDFAEEYKGNMVKLEPEITPPQLPLKKEDATGFLESYDYIKMPPNLR